MRGTPQQIIDKYNQLARDAQLSNDRVATENFQQHAEHYLRILGEAQREQDARREEQERQNRERQSERDRDRDRGPRHDRDTQNGSDDPSHSDQPDILDLGNDSSSDLVDTPESQQPKSQEQFVDQEVAAPVAKPKPKPRSRGPRKPKLDAQPSEAPGVSE